MRNRQIKMVSRILTNQIVGLLTLVNSLGEKDSN